MVYLFLADGFEEIEALTQVDYLRRAGIDIKTCGIGGEYITGSKGITVKADMPIEQVSLADADMLILPGGLGGVKGIRENEKAMSLLRQAYVAGIRISAICAAPTVLARLGITDGKNATCYPGMEGEMGSAKMQDLPAVTDGRVITGRAAGAAFDFALALITALRGQEIAAQVAAGIVYRG